MKLVIASLIVLLATQLCLLVGTLCNLLFSLIFSWLPEKARMGIWYLTSVISGAIGSVVAIGFAYLIFRFVAGVKTFHLGIFGAALVSLFTPLKNDYKKLVQLQNTLTESEFDSVKDHFKSDVIGFRNWFAGEIIGLVASLAFVLLY